jgi:hypothetical protein
MPEFFHIKLNEFKKQNKHFKNNWCIRTTVCVIQICLQNCQSSVLPAAVDINEKMLGESYVKELQKNSTYR